MRLRVGREIFEIEKFSKEEFRRRIGGRGLGRSLWRGILLTGGE